MTPPPASSAGPGLLLDVFPGLFPGGGIGRYVRDLADLLLTRADAPPARFVYPRFVDGIQVPYPAERLRPLPLGWRRMRVLLVASALCGLRPDRLYGCPALVHSPMGYGPLFSKAKLLITIHDLNAIHHPEWHPLRTRFLVQATMPSAARHADLVVCDSEFVRGQVMEAFGVDPARITTVPLAVGPAFRRLPPGAARDHMARRFGIEGEFFLHVGTLEPRKNHVGLVAAFERVRRAGFPGPLVLVGHDGWLMNPIAARIESSPDSGAIVRIRDADEDDLVALYSACTAFAFPSLDEGFGLPPLEAMACGAPCISSNRSSLPEVVGDAAVSLDPGDVEAWAETLRGLWRDADRRATMAAASVARAQRFTRDRWIARMLEIYRVLLAGAS
ncbi:MAG TPA: glycosyltransferase family 1 protein [Candidatus Eisenbacteria bacterium]|jgi:glycosyltransferase involved in cell wall biosynthesis